MLISVVVIGFAIVLVNGVPTFYDSGENEPIVEDSLRSVASAGERVALGTTETESVELKDGTRNPGRYSLDEDAGAITVTIGGTQYINGDLGTLTYKLEDGATLAYQGGGVFRSPGSSSSSSVVTAPPMTIRNAANSDPTFTGSFITVSADSGVSGEATITQGSATQNYRQQRVPSSEVVRIQVQSRYYQAWYRYFTETMGISEANAAVDDSTSTAEVVYGGGTEFFINPTRIDLEFSS
jgi:hypothetical protein